MTEVKAEPKPGLERNLPPPGVNVIVQCDHVRCLAYRTTTGKWLTTFTREELKNVVRFFPLV